MSLLRKRCKEDRCTHDTYELQYHINDDYLEIYNQCTICGKEKDNREITKEELKIIMETEILNKDK
jgi:hypothetical protein